MSDSASEALSRYDLAEHVRKMKMAEREQYHRAGTGSNGKPMTVAEAENLSRIECKQEVEDCKESLRKKKRVEIILKSTEQILHAISYRIEMIE